MKRITNVVLGSAITLLVALATVFAVAEIRREEPVY